MIVDKLYRVTRRTFLTEVGGIVLWLAYGIGEVLGRRRGSGYGMATLFAIVVG